MVALILIGLQGMALGQDNNTLKVIKTCKVIEANSDEYLRLVAKGMSIGADLSILAPYARILNACRDFAAANTAVKFEAAKNKVAELVEELDRISSGR